MNIIKLLSVLALILISCGEGSPDSNLSPEEVAQNWTDKTRIHIIKTHVSENEENRTEFIKNTISGIGIDFEKPLETEDLTTTVIVGKVKSLRYIKIRRSNGLLYYNAITLNDSIYGAAEWFRENGNYEKIGYYFDGLPCGKWKYYSSSNDLDSIVDFGNNSLLLNFDKSPFSNIYTLDKD